MSKKVKDILCFNCHIVKPVAEYSSGERRCNDCINSIYSKFDFTHKKCGKCKIEKPIKNFYQSKATKTGIYPNCKDCSKESKKRSREKSIDLKQKTKQYKQNYRKKHPERNNGYYRRRNLSKYNLSLLEYENILNSQNGACAICLKNEIINDNFNKMAKLLSIDHDHNTGKVRGLLCNKCNTGLGLFEDSIESLVKAIEYLRRSNDE